jgi:hypothetical protein
VRRRAFLGTVAASPLLLAAVPSVRSREPYGELQTADANGLMLPPGFTSREIGRQGQTVGASAYPWHVFPDGGATFATADGGWIYVSNSELLDGGGGVGAVRFAADGTITDAYPICRDTSTNCAGGATPWGTWLTCEEVEGGQVWECDPFGVEPAVVRPALGQFKHEAVAVDPVNQQLYLTEDNVPGRLYRFTPTSWEDLTEGVLEEAVTDDDGNVTWTQDKGGGTEYSGGEGMAYFDGKIVFTTKSDSSIRELDIEAARMRVLYAPGDGLEIEGPDNITLSSYGDLYVCEDNGGLEQELVLIAPDGTRSVVVRSTGNDGSELAGVAFNPAEDRMYFSSQRGAGGGGITYEVSGPFRQFVATTTTQAATSDDDEASAPPVNTSGGTNSSDDGPPWPAIGAAAAVGVAVIGGVAWLRSRRGTEPADGDARPTP